ncbi:integrase core domain-containing protein [Chitinivorax tropicus]|uniref:integrase core domain-containing protein n=1 Tax=Chitinivorax tropicus TaxID=714531 RepID=UPI003CCE52E3
MALPGLWGTGKHISRVIADRIGYYNHQRPHQVLGTQTPMRRYQLAAWPAHKGLGHDTAA